MALTEPDAGSDLAAVQTRADDRGHAGPGDGRVERQRHEALHHERLRRRDPRAGAQRGPEEVRRRARAELLPRREEPRTSRCAASRTSSASTAPRPARSTSTSAPAFLIGKRGMGLARYTAWLMLAARLAVGAQAAGHLRGRAAARRASTPTSASSSGSRSRSFAQVAAMLVDMQVYTEARRALLYFDERDRRPAPGRGGSGG